MTKEGKQELWHTWRGPVMSLIGGIAASIILAAFWWAVGFKAYKQAVGDRLDSQDKSIAKQEVSIVRHDGEIQQIKIDAATDRATFLTEIRNLNRNIRRRDQ